MINAYYITGICEPAVAFSGWTTSTGWMIIGALFLANVLDETGLLKRIAYACIRAVGGSFNGVLYGIYIAGVVLAFVSVNSAYAIVVTLGFAICVALKLNPGSKGAAVVMMAAAAGALSPGVFLYRPSWGQSSLPMLKQLIQISKCCGSIFQCIISLVLYLVLFSSLL